MLCWIGDGGNVLYVNEAKDRVKLIRLLFYQVPKVWKGLEVA